ncbi:MAG: type II secretion system protein [Patescibacteria group bacterium]
MKNIKISVNGFTIIELLVVIAIIGILASIVTASVNIARTKGADVAILQNMAGARTQAALYYSGNTDSYVGVCDTTASADGTATINANLVGAQTAWGTSTKALNINLATAGSFDTVTCHESTDGSAFAVETPLKATASGAPVMYCLDSVGVAKEKTTNLIANVTSCE